MKKLTPVILLLISVLSATGQINPRKSSYSREIGTDAENDIFFLIDYYYTAGHDVYFRRLASPDGALHRKLHAGSDSSKVIVNYTAGFKIFNPRNIDSVSTKTMDRPYAGWTYVKYGVTNFPSPTASNKYEAEVGVVGHDSGMEKLQAYVHNALDFVVPAGWASQIRNEIVVNFYYTRYKQIPLLSKLDLVTTSAVMAGTGGNRLSQDVTLRMLNFNPINNSSFNQSKLSWDNPEQGKSKRNEFFFFAGLGGDYVLSNIFIQGSIFNDHKSVFTVPVQRFILRQTFGLILSGRSATWSMSMVHLTKEVKNGIDHRYGSLGLAVRF